MILIHPFIFIEEYATNDVCHARYPFVFVFALAVAFVLKQRNSLLPLSTTAWQLTREEYALSPAALRMRGKSQISRLNSFAAEPFQSAIVKCKITLDVKPFTACFKAESGAIHCDVHASSPHLRGNELRNQLNIRCGHFQHSSCYNTMLWQLFDAQTLCYKSI